MALAKLLILVFAGFSLVGCVSQERRQRAERVEAVLGDKYDLSAMLAFLKKTIADHPTVDGIRLSTNIRQSWHFEPVDPPARLRSGDWVLYDPKPGGDQFELSFWTGQSSEITIYGKRISRDQFEVIRIARDDIVELAR